MRSKSHKGRGPGGEGDRTREDACLEVVEAAAVSVVAPPLRRPDRAGTSLLHLMSWLSLGPKSSLLRVTPARDASSEPPCHS